MLHWPKKSLVMPFYYINFDQNGPPYISIYFDFGSLEPVSRNSRPGSFSLPKSNINRNTSYFQSGKNPTDCLGFIVTWRFGVSSSYKPTYSETFTQKTRISKSIRQAVRLKKIENDIECTIYKLESNNYYQSVERTRGSVVQKMTKWLLSLVFPQ